jgi:hypothetical protein
MKVVLRFLSLFLFLTFISSAFAQELPEHSGPGVIYNNQLDNQNSNVRNPNNTLATNYVLPDNGSTSGNSRAPQGLFRFERSVYLITAAELQAAGVLTGVSFTSIGFIYSVAQDIPTSGTFQVYFQNTADVANNMSATWATAITTMTKVDSSADVIPSALVFDHALSNPSAFTYTGGGIYVAWEYSNPLSAIAAVANTALCTNSLAAGLKGAQSNTALPVALTASAFRPGTRLAYPVGTDAGVVAVYTLGKLPLGAGVPDTVTAVIKNTGDNVITSLPCTLSVKGSNTFSNIQTIASLAVGASTVVSFSFTPTAIGADTLTVTIPADVILTNNSKTVVHTVNNTNTFAYSDGAVFTAATLWNALGLGAAGSMVSKFFVNGNYILNSAKVFIYNGVGKTVRGIAFNKTGAVIAQTADYVLQTADSVNYVNFIFPTPPSINNDVVYVGLFTGTPVSGWFPMGIEQETPTRSGAFFSISSGGVISDLGSNNYGKFMIEATFSKSPTSLLMSEDFSAYSAGPLAGQGGWIHGGSGTDAPAVTSATPLTYPGYNFGGGNYLNFATNSATAGKLVKGWSDSLSILTPGGVIYTSFLLNLTTTFPASNGYFLSLGQNSLSQYVGKFFAKQITAATYNLGVSNVSTTTEVFSPAVLNTGQTYLVIMRYNINNTATQGKLNTIQVWINPAGAAEPDTNIADIKYPAIDSTFTATLINGFFWHNRNATNPLGSVDGIRVAGSTLSSAAAWAMLNPGSLPVELTSFTANASNGKVNLTWATASELNNRGFDVERKSASDNSWATISFVKGNGSTLSAKHYSYTDNSVNSGKYIYRLKQIDDNGTFKYSNEVNADINVPGKFSLSQNYPNPFNPSTKINYTLPVDSRVKIELFNITGQRVAELVNNEQPAGFYSLNVGANTFSKIASGVYIYKMTAIEKATGKNFMSSMKLMLMK